jgi:capsular polysaccharide biosynthesis protein
VIIRPEAKVQLKDYLVVLRKRGWIILLAAVLTAAGAFVFSKIQTPVYRSSIRLNAIPARLDWGLTQVITGMLRNYSGQIQSRRVLLQVIEQTQLDVTPEQLAENLRVSPVESDLLIQIDVDDYDPVLAAQIAQTIAEVFVDKIKVDMQDQDNRDRVNVSIRDDAQIGVLHSPKWKINTLAGLVFGALIGAIVVFAIVWLESDTVHRGEDVERHLGLPILGVIPAVQTPRESHRGVAK